jgi:hypothetical protein
MAIIKNLDILLGARTEGLDKDLGVARGIISRFTAGAERSGGAGGGGVIGSMAGGISGMAAAAGKALPVIGAVFAAYTTAAGAAHQFAEAAERVEGIAKASDKLGVPIEEYQKLSYAVRQSAALSEEGFGQALQTMARGVSQASVGMGKAEKILQEMGLDAAELNNLSPDQQFMRIAERMQ